MKSFCRTCGIEIDADPEGDGDEDCEKCDLKNREWFEKELKKLTEKGAKTNGH